MWSMEMRTSTGRLSRQFLEQSGGGFPRNERNEDDSAAGLLDRAALRLIERFEGVIAAFGVDVRLGRGEETGGAHIGKNADRVDRFQRGEDSGAIIFAVHRTAFPFKPADGGVAIHANEQHVTMVAGVLKVGDVAEVEKIEAAVGHDQAFLSAELRAPGGEVGVRNDFGAKVQDLFFDRSGRKVEVEKGNWQVHR